MEHSTNYNLCFTTMNQFLDCIEKIMNKINAFESPELCVIEVNQNITPKILELEKMLEKFRVTEPNKLTEDEYKVLYSIYDIKIAHYDIKLLKKFNLNMIYDVIQTVKTILLGLKESKKY